MYRLKGGCSTQPRNEAKGRKGSLQGYSSVSREAVNLRLVKEVEMVRMRRWRGKGIGLWYSSDEIFKC